MQYHNLQLLVLLTNLPVLLLTLCFAVWGRNKTADNLFLNLIWWLFCFSEIDFKILQ
jgi:hypothetical protein